MKKYQVRKASFSNQPPLILVGGHDPSTHAGIFADAQVLQEHKINFRVVITAVTAQNDEKFFIWQAVSPKLFSAQLESLPKKIAGVKIGMLATLKHVAILNDWLKQKRPAQIIWDPVLKSSSGGQLLKAKSWSRTLQDLLDQTTLFTPNALEAEWILKTPIKNLQQQEKAALKLYQLGKQKKIGVLIKGGHIEENPQQVVDVYADQQGLKKIIGKRYLGNRRGTGCRLASATLVYLLKNENKFKALIEARAYLNQ